MNGRDASTRVVLVCEAAGGGVGKHVLDVAERLPRLGFDVLVVHSARRAEPDFVERVSRHDSLGYDVAHVDVDRAPGARDLLGAMQLRRAVRAFGGAHVLHGHSAKGGALARLARWGCARRVFYTPHAFYAQAPDLSSAARRVYGLAEYGLAFATDRVIATSREEHALARSLGIPERKLTVVENGIEVRSDRELIRARMEARASLGIGLDEVVVGFVGRLVPQKRPVLAVETFRRIASGPMPARFLFVGDGPEAPGVSLGLAGSDIASHMHWLRRGVGRELLPAVDVLLVTSSYEGFSYVMLEGLEAGCAIVTTPVGGAVDCVVPHGNGAITSGDATALADASRPFVESPDRLRAAHAVSRERVRRFEIGHMLDRLASLYRCDTRDTA